MVELWIIKLKMTAVKVSEMIISALVVCAASRISSRTTDMVPLMPAHDMMDDSRQPNSFLSFGRARTVPWMTAKRIRMLIAKMTKAMPH